MQANIYKRNAASEEIGALRRAKAANKRQQRRAESRLTSRVGTMVASPVSLWIGPARRTSVVTLSSRLGVVSTTEASSTSGLSTTETFSVDESAVLGSEQAVAADNPGLTGEARRSADMQPRVEDAADCVSGNHHSTARLRLATVSSAYQPIMLGRAACFRSPSLYHNRERSCDDRRALQFRAGEPNHSQSSSLSSFFSSFGLPAARVVAPETMS